MSSPAPLEVLSSLKKELEHKLNCNLALLKVCTRQDRRHTLAQKILKRQDQLDALTYAISHLYAYSN